MACWPGSRAPPRVMVRGSLSAGLRLKGHRDHRTLAGNSTCARRRVAVICNVSCVVLFAMHQRHRPAHPGRETLHSKCLPIAAWRDRSSTARARNTRSAPRRLTGFTTKVFPFATVISPGSNRKFAIPCVPEPPWVAGWDFDSRRLRDRSLIRRRRARGRSWTADVPQLDRVRRSKSIAAGSAR